MRDDTRSPRSCMYESGQLTRQSTDARRAGAALVATSTELRRHSDRLRAQLRAALAARTRTGGQPS